MKKLFLLLIPILLVACEQKQDWELTYTTTAKRITAVATTTTTSTYKEVLLDYTEKKVQEHIEATTGGSVEYFSNFRVVTTITCTYKPL